jgi:hypothetical protein
VKDLHERWQTGEVGSNSIEIAEALRRSTGIAEDFAEEPASPTDKSQE